MDMIESCIVTSDVSGVYALQSTWDDSNPSVFSSHFLTKTKKTLLMTACKEGRFECCKFLLSIDSPHVNTRYMKISMLTYCNPLMLHCR